MHMNMNMHTHAYEHAHAHTYAHAHAHAPTRIRTRAHAQAICNVQSHVPASLAWVLRVASKRHITAAAAAVLDEAHLLSVFSVHHTQRLVHALNLQQNAT